MSLCHPQPQGGPAGPDPESTRRDREGTPVVLLTGTWHFAGMSELIGPVVVRKVEGDRVVRSIEVRRRVDVPRSIRRPLDAAVAAVRSSPDAMLPHDLLFDLADAMLAPCHDLDDDQVAEVLCLPREALATLAVTLFGLCGVEPDDLLPEPPGDDVSPGQTPDPIAGADL